MNEAFKYLKHIQIVACPNVYYLPHMYHSPKVKPVSKLFQKSGNFYHPRHYNKPHILCS